MKNLIIFLAIFIFSGLSFCTKDPNIYPTPDVSKDTVVVSFPHTPPAPVKLKIQSHYSFDVFYKNSNKSFNMLSDTLTSGYFKDETGGGILYLASGIFSSGERITSTDSIKSSLNISAPSNYDANSYYNVNYESSIYSEPFNSSEGWTLSYWLKVDSSIFSSNIVGIRQNMPSLNDTIKDLYESRVMYFGYDENKFVFSTTYQYGEYDTINNIGSMKPVELSFKNEGVSIDSIDKWHNYVVSYSNDTLSMYIDGEIQFNSKINFKSFSIIRDGYDTEYFTDNIKYAKFDAFNIGCQGSSLIEFPVWLSEMYIWNKKLTDKEVLDNYKNQR